MTARGRTTCHPKCYLFHTRHFSEKKKISNTLKQKPRKFRHHLASCHLCRRPQTEKAPIFRLRLDCPECERTQTHTYVSCHFVWVGGISQVTPRTRRHVGNTSTDFGMTRGMAPAASRLTWKRGEEIRRSHRGGKIANNVSTWGEDSDAWRRFRFCKKNIFKKKQLKKDCNHCIVLHLWFQSKVCKISFKSFSNRLNVVQTWFSKASIM